jgi:hypothetical protein
MSIANERGREEEEREKERERGLGYLDRRGTASTGTRIGTGRRGKKLATEMRSARVRSRFINAVASWVMVDAPGLTEIRSVSIREASGILMFIVALHLYRRKGGGKSCRRPSIQRLFRRRVFEAKKRRFRPV